MPLPSSGSLSMSQIAAEFGGSAPHSLSEYYGVASGIPSSGTISFNQFYGAANAAYVYATGGSVSQSGNYRTHYFYSNGYFNITNGGNSAGSNSVTYLIVAGGGGGSGQGELVQIGKHDISDQSKQTLGDFLSRVTQGKAGSAGKSNAFTVDPTLSHFKLTDPSTGLASRIEPVRIGGRLQNHIPTL